MLEQRQNLQGLAQLKFDLKQFVWPPVGQVKDYTDILREFLQMCFYPIFFFWELPGFTKGDRLGRIWHQCLSCKQPRYSSFWIGNATRLDTGRVRNGCLNWVFQRVLFRDLTISTLSSQHWITTLPKGF